MIEKQLKAAIPAISDWSRIVIASERPGGAWGLTLRMGGPKRRLDRRRPNCKTSLRPRSGVPAGRYEPVWAIGTGVVATPEQAQSAHAVPWDTQGARER